MQGLLITDSRHREFYPLIQMAHATLLHPLDYKQMQSESKNGNALKCVQCKTSVRCGFVCISKFVLYIH